MWLLRKMGGFQKILVMMSKKEILGDDATEVHIEKKLLWDYLFEKCTDIDLLLDMDNISTWF